MRKITYFLLMVALPTGLFATSNASAIRGNYYDPHTDTEIRIKHHRRGIKVKVNGRRWRTYNFMGRGVYDDCNGRVIIDLGYGDIKYIKGRRRNTIILSRINRNRYRDDRSWGGNYNGYSNPRGGYGNYGVNQYCGTWACADPGITLHIEAFGNGFRARKNRDQWVYYDRYRDGTFRDRRGNRYYFDDRYLIWSSRQGNRRIRFRKG